MVPVYVKLEMLYDTCSWYSLFFFSFSFSSSGGLVMFKVTTLPRSNSVSCLVWRWNRSAVNWLPPYQANPVGRMFVLLHSSSRSVPPTPDTRGGRWCFTYVFRTCRRYVSVHSSTNQFFFLVFFLPAFRWKIFMGETETTAGCGVVGSPQKAQCGLYLAELARSSLWLCDQYFFVLLLCSMGGKRGTILKQERVCIRSRQREGSDLIMTALVRMFYEHVSYVPGITHQAVCSYFIY